MTLDHHEARRIHSQIQAARQIVLVAHVDPDGDAIGSLLGLGWLLRALDKDVILACQDPVPEMYRWLPGAAGVVQLLGCAHGSGGGAVSHPALEDGHCCGQEGACDLVISLDCSDLGRIGTVLEHNPPSLPLINIDHHITNTRFGTVNWVDPASVATSQMVLALAEGLDWAVSQPVAICLLTGLVTDTRGFRTANVDAQTMRSALRLVEAGASLSEVARRALDQLPLASVRLWGDAIDRLQLDDGILWTEVTRAMIQRWAAGEDGSTGLTNFLAGVREAEVIAVFSERHDGVVDVGLRAVPGYDVAQVALRLGGGGHPQAAGCTLQGSLSQVRERVLDEVRRSLASD